MKAIHSAVDSSVNFIIPAKGGFFESRYVRRREDYFICYLSSHSGCNKGCGFCHLTTTKQTSMHPATPDDFMEQALKVFNHYRIQEGGPAREVHFNWMARGEALSNPYMLDHFQAIHRDLLTLARAYGLIAKFNVSTILPKTLAKPLEEVFNGIYPTIYYSLYSMDKEFRNKWLPGAMPAEVALTHLQNYQKVSKKIIKLHYALIEGENDSPSDVARIGNEIASRGLLTELNLVRYNAPNWESRESSNYEEYVHEWDWLVVSKSKIVDRVGLDCFASCGMFYSG